MSNATYIKSRDIRVLSEIRAIRSIIAQCKTRNIHKQNPSAADKLSATKDLVELTLPHIERLSKLGVNGTMLAVKLKDHASGKVSAKYLYS